MTRKRKRDIERDLDDLDDTDQDGDSLRVVIRHDLVDEDGELVETNEEIIEI